MNTPLLETRLDHRPLELWLGSESWRRVPVWRGLLTDAVTATPSAPSSPAPARATVWRTNASLVPTCAVGLAMALFSGPLLRRCLRPMSKSREKPGTIKDVSALYVRDPRGQPFLTALAFLVSRGLTHRFPGPNGFPDLNLHLDFCSFRVNGTCKVGGGSEHPDSVIIDIIMGAQMPTDRTMRL